MEKLKFRCLRQRLKIFYVERIAYRMGFVNEGRLLKIAEKYNNNCYYKYLKKVQKSKMPFKSLQIKEKLFKSNIK